MEHNHPPAWFVIYRRMTRRKIWMETKKLFDIDGIHMLGNFDNGAVIGLDDEGYAM